MSNPFNEEDGGQVTGSTPSVFTDSTTTQSSESSLATRKIEDRNNVITARGTSEGLVLRIDGRVEAEDLLVAVREFLNSRRSFLSGNDVAFEWIGKRPDDAIIQTVAAILHDEFSVSVRASKQKVTASSKENTIQKGATSEPSPAPEERPSKEGIFSVLGGGRTFSSGKSSATPDKGVSLFDGIEPYESRAGSSNPMSWDEPDARIVYGTLRSGQKIETEHSIIVVGDVNSGAEVIAGGDVVILGTLRGIAHAGAYDESGGGRVILSLNLRPTQLRIGLVISRGSGAEDAESTPRGGLPEVARVDGNMIVVEPYQSRTVWVRRRE
jgi:septum site-determining protein MinC